MIHTPTHSTLITIPVDSPELSIQVAADSIVSVGDSVAGLPGLTDVRNALRDTGSVDLQLGEAWQYVGWDQYDGRTLYQVSDGVKRFTIPADANAWHNPILARDINGNGLVSPLDVLLVITELNQFGGHAVVAPPNPEGAASFFDVNHDHRVSPIDVLIVIDYLNAIPGTEGEGESTLSWAWAGMRSPWIGSINSQVDLAAGDRFGRAAEVEQERISHDTSLPMTFLTDLPLRDSLNVERLWDVIAGWEPDKDFEDLLADLVAPDDRPSELWDR